MKVLISATAWGARYVSTFLEYSLASQLSRHNLPQLASTHEVTYHILTRRRNVKNFLRHGRFREIDKFCEVIFENIEDYGYDALYIPSGSSSDKYSFLSRLQNISIERSLNHDAVVFNYADFVWADGSLFNAVALVEHSVDAVLSFCLPVDQNTAKSALEHYRRNGKRGDPIDLPPRSAARLATDLLHRETRLRFWDGPQFTSMPSYLLWPVDDDGLIIRAYHQTILVLRVQHKDPRYLAGISRGTLDGHFTAALAERARFVHAVDSDQVMVFSLYDDRINTSLRENQSREESLRTCLRTAISENQRRFAEVPIYVKREYTDSSRWESVTRESANVIRHFHETTPSDPDSFHSESNSANIETYEVRWRRPARRGIRWFVWFYRRLLPRLLIGRVGQVARRLLRTTKARALRAKIGRRIFTI